MKNVSGKAFWGYKKRDFHKYVDLILKEHEDFISNIRERVDATKSRKIKLQMELTRLNNLLNEAMSSAVEESQEQAIQPTERIEEIPLEIEQTKVSNPTINAYNHVERVTRKLEESIDNFYQSELSKLKKLMVSRQNEIHNILDLIIAERNSQEVIIDEDNSFELKTYVNDSAEYEYLPGELYNASEDELIEAGKDIQTEITEYPKNEQKERDNNLNYFNSDSWNMPIFNNQKKAEPFVCSSSDELTE